MLALAAILFSLSITHAQVINGIEGVYHCAVEGREQPVLFQVEDQQLHVHGLATAMNDSMTCTNQRLTKQQGGAVYTLVSACDGTTMFRSLTLDRPDALETFSMATELTQLSADSLRMHVRVKFTGTVDQNLDILCRK